MLRLLKALLLALAVCALSIFSTSCGSGGSAQVRVFNAIPDNGANGSIALDLWFNDNLVITALGVNAITPAATTPAKYLNIASGNDTIVAYDTGTESNPIASNGSEDGLSSSTEYTLLLGGFTDSPPTHLAFGRIYRQSPHSLHYPGRQYSSGGKLHQSPCHRRIGG